MSTGMSGDATFDSCDHCGQAFSVDVQYPATVHEDDDGTLRILSFCDERCQRAWADDD